MPDINDSFKIGSKCIIVNDVDLRGDITVGSGCVLHPKCTIVAVSGPIIIGSNNIIEENAVIVNRSKLTMIVGDNNHFQVGSRVESPLVGSDNVFEIRSRVAFNVSVGSNCHIGAGCVVLPSPFPPAFVTSSTETSQAAPDSPAPPPVPAKDDEHAPPKDEFVPPARATSQETVVETLPDFTQVYGGDCRRQKWSGEGSAQAKAFYAKHLEYLRDTLPKFNKLKMF